MSTPNPVLVAAAPTLINALGLVETFITTITTGDPLQIPARIAPAAAILVGQLELLLPGLATAEVGAVNTEVNAKIAGLIAKLKAVEAPAAAAPVV